MEACPAWIPRHSAVVLCFCATLHPWATRGIFPKQIMQNHFSPKSSCTTSMLPNSCWRYFWGPGCSGENPAAGDPQCSFAWSYLRLSSIKGWNEALWHCLSLPSSSLFPKHAGCVRASLVPWALAAKDYTVLETEAQTEMFIWEPLAHHLDFSSLGWGNWLISHEMPALTTLHAFPTAERHKVCPTHFGEPREEEVQQDTEIVVSSGTHPSKRGWKWFKSVALSAWVS